LLKKTKNLSVLHSHKVLSALVITILFILEIRNI